MSLSGDVRVDIEYKLLIGYHTLILDATEIENKHRRILILEQRDVASIPPVTAPPGYAEGDKVCRLHKALYGLKQAGHTWYIKIDKWLKDQGYERIESDHGLYVHPLVQDTIIVLYVDDVIILTKEEHKLIEIKQALSTAFKMTDGGVCYGTQFELE